MLRADRGVRLHRLPLVGVERPGLGQDLVGDADLAHVVERAGVAQQLRLGGRHADRQAEPLAEAADALDVQPGLGVAPLDRHAEPLDDLDLGLPQLLRALADALLEQLVVARDARRRGSRPAGSRRSCRRRRRPAPTSGADDVEDQAGVERELSADQEQRRRRSARPGPTASAGRRMPTSGATRASSATSSRPASGGELVQRRAVERRPDRVRLDLGACHRARSPTGVECTSRSVGAEAPTTTMRPRNRLGSRRGRGPRRRRRRCGRCRAGRGSRSRRRRRRRRSRAATARRRACAARPGSVSSPPTLAGEAGDHARRRRCAGRRRPPERGRGAGWRRRRARRCGRARRSRWWRARRRRRRRSRRYSARSSRGVVGSVNWTS